MKIPTEVHTILTAARDLLTISADTVSLTLPPLSPKDYAAVDAVLKAIGLKWSRNAQAHTGPASLAARLAAAISTGTCVHPKRDREFFATPPALAAVLADLLAQRLVDDEPVRILEPSAGDGSLIDAVLACLPLAQITAVEKDSLAADALRVKYAADPRVRVVTADFAAFTDDEHEHAGGFDGVLMNPPFSKARCHVARAFDLLRDHGELVGIMPIEAADPSRPLGIWFAERDGYVEDNAAGAFRASGTDVPTSLVTLTKQRSRSAHLREALCPPKKLVPLIDRLERLSHDVLCLVATETQRQLHQHEEETLFARRLEACAVADALGAKLIAHCDPRGGYGLGLKVPNGDANTWGGHLIVPPIARRNTAPFTPTLVTGASRLASTSGIPASSDHAAVPDVPPEQLGSAGLRPSTPRHPAIQLSLF